jgi:hypothetical protein
MVGDFLLSEQWAERATGRMFYFDLTISPRIEICLLWSRSINNVTVRIILHLSQNENESVHCKVKSQRRIFERYRKAYETNKPCLLRSGHPLTRRNHPAELSANLSFTSKYNP